MKIIICLNYKAITVTAVFYESIFRSSFPFHSSSSLTTRFGGRDGRRLDATEALFLGFGVVGGFSMSACCSSVKRSLKKSTLEGGNR